MADVQLENGYIRIATDLGYAMTRTRISGEEGQIFWTILMKTFGFNKTEDEIALSQFEKLTNISKPHIIRAMKKLKDKNMINIAKNGKQSNIYSIVKDFDLWKPLPKKVILPKKEIIIAKKGNKPLPKKEHTIDSKDINNIIDKKKVTTFSSDDSPYKLSLLLLQEIIKENPLSRLDSLSTTEKERTVQSWAKDIALLTGKDNQKPSTVEEVIKWATHDNFWRANILSAKKLREKWDTLTAQMNKGDNHGSHKGNNKPNRATDTIIYSQELMDKYSPSQDK